LFLQHAAADRKALFESLKKKRAEAHESNKKDVAEEAVAQEEDPKLAAKKQRQVAEANELKAKKEAEEKGLDYERVKAWSTHVAEAQKDQREKEWKEKNQDVGFSSMFFFSRFSKVILTFTRTTPRHYSRFSAYEEASLRKYKRLSRSLKPNTEEYVQQKAALGADFYPDANNLTYGFYSKVPESKIDALVDDLKSQYESPPFYPFTLYPTHLPF